MSFEVQSGPSSCGLASLRYAFSLLGAGLRRNAELEEEDIRKKIGKHAWRVHAEGVQEDELRRGARKLGLTMEFHRFHERDPDAVIALLRRATAKNHPCIVSVHDDDSAHFHWICVAGFSGDRALVFDPSALDDDMSESTYWLADNEGSTDFVPALMKVSRLAAWIDTSDELADEIEDECGGEHHTVLEVAVAADRKRDFVPGMADEALIRRMRRDLDLAESFDQYMDDLKDIFGPPSWDGSAGVPAHRFIERNHKRIDALFKTWTLSEYCDGASIAEEIQNLLAITRCYDFRVRSGDEERVWANLAFHLGWFAAECSYEVGRFED